MRESLSAEELGRLFALTGRISTEKRYETVVAIVGPRLAPEVGRESEAALFDWAMGGGEGEPPD